MHTTTEPAYQNRPTDLFYPIPHLPKRFQDAVNDGSNNACGKLEWYYYSRYLILPITGVLIIVSITLSLFIHDLVIMVITVLTIALPFLFILCSYNLSESWVHRHRCNYLGKTDLYALENCQDKKARIQIVQLLREVDESRQARHTHDADKGTDLVKKMIDFEKLQLGKAVSIAREAKYETLARSPIAKRIQADVEPFDIPSKSKGYTFWENYKEEVLENKAKIPKKGTLKPFRRSR